MLRRGQYRSLGISACCESVSPPVPRPLLGGGGKDVEAGHLAQQLEALVDLLARQAGDPLGAELLDVEGGEHGAVAHRAPQAGVVDRSFVAVDVAEEAAGEAVTGAGRVADVLEREAGKR